MTFAHRELVRAIRVLTPALRPLRLRQSKAKETGAKAPAAKARREDLAEALRWNATGNVLGFGIGPKRKDDHCDYGTRCLIVFVARKLGKRKVPPGEGIPSRVQLYTIDRRLQTDIIEVGSLPRLQASFTLQPGTNAAHFSQRAGSITAVVKTRTTPSQLRLLSVSHGFAPPGFAGPQIESPPDLSATGITNWVANLDDFEPLREGGVIGNRLDAAIAAPRTNVVPLTSNNIPGFGLLQSTSSLESGEFLENGVRQIDGVGATTPHVRGDIIAENVSTLLGDVIGRLFLYEDLVAYDPMPITDAGDSGMPLFVRVPGSGLQLVGMHIGFGRILGTRRGAAFFSPIKRALDRFQVDLV
jgi:hypothetical protein